MSADDEGALQAPAVPRRREPAEELWELRYPRRVEHTPPAGLSRRAQRRWLRDARAEERDERTATVRSWRDRPDRTSPGLAVAVLAVAVLFAGLVFWPDGDPPPSGTVTATTVDRAPGPPAAPAPAPTLLATPPPVDGHDHGDAPAPPPGLFDGPAGQAAYAFVLGYLTYSPAYPDPLDTWVTGWGEHATDDLKARAGQLADELYGFTVTEAVHVTDPAVLKGTRDGDTWSLRCAWVLFPIGGDESATTRPEEVDVALTVTDGRVSDVRVSGRAPQSDA